MDKNKNIIYQSISQYITALKDQIIVEKVILYGSWANGIPHEYSDIELAIFSPDFGKSKLRELQFLSKMSWKVNTSIEAIPYSSDKLFSNDPSSFVSEILKTGEVVYDSTSA